MPLGYRLGRPLRTCWVTGPHPWTMADVAPAAPSRVTAADNADVPFGRAPSHPESVIRWRRLGATRQVLVTGPGSADGKADTGRALLTAPG
jgi:hypothetical protein